MLQKIYQVTTGGLLHDIGKIIFRAQSIDSRAHALSGYEAMQSIIEDPAILRCIRYHHKKDISEANLAENDLAYYVYIADNIASGADRRESEIEELRNGFDKALPLESIYNLMNNNTARYVHAQDDFNQKNEINFPKDRALIPPYTASKYNEIYQNLLIGLKQILYKPSYMDSLLVVLESYLSYIPSSTNQKEVADISLYDHCKITAAVAACLCQYMEEAGRFHLRTELLKGEKNFLNEKAFLMFSCDLSGIQSFLYTTSGDGALKSLRSRSLYLEILLEHIADEILKNTGLSRTNLIYTGGGHAYLLLTNTKETIEKLQTINRILNQWFIKHFDTDLYLAMAWQPCSGNDLMNKEGEKDGYQQIFRELSRKLGAKKISRYTAEELLQLNATVTTLNGQEKGRECKECRRSKELLEDDICSFCSNLKQISAEVIKGEGYFAVLKQPETGQAYLPLPDLDGEDVYLQIMNESMMRDNLQKENAVHFYSKNQLVTGHTLATRIWMGDYHIRENFTVASFASLANYSQGVKRIGVLRADVDNLGQAFVNGFVRQNEEDPFRYLTISRTATLSRSLSLFFKYHLNTILAGKSDFGIQPFSLDGKPRSGPRKVMIIYSGGDDMFLVGAWNEIIECAVDIHRLFSCYTQNTLTLSAGIGVYPANYPLVRMAEKSGELESLAKHLDVHKNALALFGTEVIADDDLMNHCYHWDQFEKQVVEEKLRFLQKHLGVKTDGTNNNTAFLYQILQLLRNTKYSINLARFAYALARRERSDKNEALQREFCDRMYDWYLDKEQRGQLITAIYLYVYLYRE